MRIRPTAPEWSCIVGGAALGVYLSAGAIRGVAQPPTILLPPTIWSDPLVVAMIAVESGGDKAAFNASEDAAGILQITPIMVRDCNRIVGEQRWGLDDRWSVDESLAMFTTYRVHYSEGASDEVVARRWVGGPDGDGQACTLEYWGKVQEAMR